MDLLIKIANNIKTHRELRGFTQTEIATRMDIDIANYQRFENIKNPPNPTVKTLQKVAEALDVDIGQLLIDPERIKSLAAKRKKNIKELKALADKLL